MLPAKASSTFSGDILSPAMATKEAATETIFFSLRKTPPRLFSTPLDARLSDSSSSSSSSSSSDSSSESSSSDSSSSSSSKSSSSSSSSDSSSSEAAAKLEGSIRPMEVSGQNSGESSLQRTCITSPASDAVVK